MKPDDPLLKILVCPIDKGPLSLLLPDDVLYNPACAAVTRSSTPSRSSSSSGEQVTETEHEAILRRLPRTNGRPTSRDEPPRVLASPVRTRRPRRIRDHVHHGPDH